MPDAPLNIQRCGVYDLLQQPHETVTYTVKGHALHLFDYALRLSCESTGQQWDALPGDLLLTPGWLSVSYCAPTPGRHICFHYRFAANELAETLVPQAVLLRPDGEPGTLQAELHHLIRDFHAADPWLRAAAPWGLLAQLHRLRTLPSADERPPPASRADLAVVAARTYLETHPGDALTVPDLAVIVGLEPNYLAEKFRERYGITLMQFRREHRLRQGRYLLQQTDYPLKAIARELGFTDPPHFSHSFRQRYGLTPGQFRAQHQLVFRAGAGGTKTDDTAANLPPPGDGG